MESTTDSAFENRLIELMTEKEKYTGYLKYKIDSVLDFKHSFFPIEGFDV